MEHGLSPDKLAQMPIAQIVAVTGVGTRHAYSLKRQAILDTTPDLPQNQRERMLVVLYAHPEARDSTALLDRFHELGTENDGHDVTKVLWSLQKTGHVTFRERQKPKRLYAISLTDKGVADAVRLAQQDDLDQILSPEKPPEPSLPPVEEDDSAIKRPWFKGNLGGWPAIRDVRDRARKTAKLTAAAEILAEIGEDDIALDLMTRTTFSPLEEEVITLLESFEELP